MAYEIRTGIVTNNYQPAFLAYLNSSPSNVTGDATAYTIPFNATLINQGSYFNTSTHTFTAPVTGFYNFFLAALLTGVNVGTTFQLQVVANGFQYNGAYINPTAAAASGGFLGQNMAVTVPLSATQTVTFVVIVSGGTKTIGIDGTNANYTYCGGYLIC